MNIDPTQFEIQKPVLKTIERGSIMYTFGQKWKAYALINDDYVIADEFDYLPSADELTASIKKCSRKKGEPETCTECPIQKYIPMSLNFSLPCPFPLQSRLSLPLISTCLQPPLKLSQDCSLHSTNKPPRQRSFISPHHLQVLTQPFCAN